MMSQVQLSVASPGHQVEGFFGKAFIDPYLAYKLGNVLVSMRTVRWVFEQHEVSQHLEHVWNMLDLFNTENQ